MKYQTFDHKSYKIHTIKTDRFKTSRIEVFFRQEVIKEKLPTLSFLAGLLSYSSKKYSTNRLLAIEKENLYKCFYNAYFTKVGKVSSMIFSLDFINPDLINEKDYLDKLIKFLFEMILKPNVKNNEFDLTSFENIKNDILLDIESINESPSKLAINNALNVLDKDSISSYSVLGTKEDIEKITRESVYNEYLNLINNSIIDIFIIGNLDMNKTISLIKDNFHINRINSFNFNYYIDNITRKKAIIKSDESSFNQSQLTILYNLINLTDEEKNVTFIVFNYILGSGGLNSKLYSYLREKNGLCYRVSSMFFKADNLLCITLSLKKENISKAIKLCNKALDEMKKGIFSEEDITDAKNNLLLSLNMSKNNQMGILNNFESKIFTNGLSIDEKINKLEKITKKDIITVANKIKINTIYSLCEEINEKNTN
ncbi:MAG: pitrilysin family protein [bacterium]|nr:pitrilysin family protein [bacterium]